MGQRTVDMGREETPPTAMPLAPQEDAQTLSVQQVEERARLIQQVLHRVMQRGIHYDVIPGTDKPTLLQPGAEKLAVTFRLAPNFLCVDRLEEWEQGFFAYRFRCELLHQVTGTLVASAEGSCNSRERRYRNQDAYTIANTVLKMAQKRAFVAAVIKATGASDLFTQDLEDYDEVPWAAGRGGERGGARPAEPAAARPQRGPSRWSLFWGRVREMGYANPEVHQALGVRRMEEWEAQGHTLDEALEALHQAAPFVARVRGLGLTVERALRLLGVATVLEVGDTDEAVRRLAPQARKEGPGPQDR